MDFLSRLDFIGEILKYDETIVGNLEKAQEATLKSKQELENSKNELSEYKAAQETMQAELEAQIIKADELMLELQNNREALKESLRKTITEEELSAKIDGTV
jgi:peptidoglycan hydrolase CwlO-like protein